MVCCPIGIADAAPPPRGAARAARGPGRIPRGTFSFKIKLKEFQGTGPESMCAWRSLRSDTLIADKPSLLALIKFVRCCGSARVS